MSSVCGWALALAIAMAWVGSVGATSIEQGGVQFGVRSAQHVSYAATDARIGAAPELDQGTTTGGSETPPAGGTGTSGALVINARFDSSITGDPNSAAIEAMVNNAIAIYESLFNDPITVSILFRYSTTFPDGSTPLPSGFLAVSNYTLYFVPWNTFIAGLTSDATTANDATANASLPGSALSTNILPSSAGGRAVGLSTPPAMFADGTIGLGGPYDGIVTLNSSQPFRFTRPTIAGLFDALRTTEHEMDEVLGLGSSINSFADLRPQDLFSWSAPGTRNVTSSGSRYFSIDGGTTSIVGFNQNPGGDFGDWLSGSCPQASPYVQNAFSCANQASDVTQTSPEGINLDVIGYDLITTGTTTSTTASTTTSTTILAAVGHLECYKGKDTRPKGAYTLDLLAGVGGFVNEPGCSLKLGAKSICVEVGKQNVSPPPPGGGPAIPSNAGSVFFSYKIKCPTQTVGPALLGDQFGIGPFSVGKASELLVPALPGPANDNFKCYKAKDIRPKATYAMNLIAGVAGFPNDLGCTAKLGASRVCVQVTEHNVVPPPPGGGPGPGPGSGARFIGYKLKCPKGVVPPGSFSDGFGSGTFAPGAAKILLVPAQ